ncbi:MAG: hypothetical protein JW927_21475 [Deltaproteobacteria bacterium]|nr:hypothetical protein [Deltaproteobacteria bacterium]
MSFILCTRKKSMPKVSIAICKKCPRFKKCPDYRLFEQPVLFPDMKKGKPGKKSKKAQTKVEISKTPSSEIQLPINFTAGK